MRTHDDRPMSTPAPATRRSLLLGAVFLMATSAIGPGFLTQTAVFTAQLGASFGFAILVSILLDIGAQLNVWRIIAVSELRAQDIANRVLPGLGHVLAGLVAIGGLSVKTGAAQLAGDRAIRRWALRFSRSPSTCRRGRAGGGRRGTTGRRPRRPARGPGRPPRPCPG